MLKDILLALLGALLGGAGVAIMQVGQWRFETTEDFVNNAGGSACMEFPKTLKTERIAPYNYQCTRVWCRSLDFPFTSGEVSKMLPCKEDIKVSQGGVNCPIEVTCYFFKDVNQHN
ncbi:MAG: hypothetical protein V9G63_05370 [Candidatus Competibacter sp.]